MTAATARTSPPLDFDFNTLPEIGNGFLAKLGAIREADPVFWSDYQHGWVITRHADVAEAFSGKLPLSAARLVQSVYSAYLPEEWPQKIPLLSQSVPHWIINADPPSHTRMRVLMGKAFGRSLVESLRTFARGNIATLLDDLERRGEAEFNEEVARVITGKTILRALGIPYEYIGQLKDWAAAITGALATINPDRETLQTGERGLREMFTLFEAEIEKRRRAPQEDIFTGLVQAVDGTDRLTMEEMVGSSVVLLLAGHDTTLNSMTLGVEALSRHPEARRFLREHPDKGDQAVQEIMRYIAMACGQTRLASEDFEWHGKRLRKGDLVYLMIAGANRDPRAFKDPETLDLARDVSRSMTFAPGLHHCIGHLLARMQLSEFFTAAYARFEDIEVLDPTIEFAPPWVFRGLPAMHVRFHPRRAA